MRRSIVLLLALAALGAAAPGAHASPIAINRSIHGIAPGMTVDEVVAKLGEPATDGGVSGTRVLSYPSRGLLISTYVDRDAVYTIQTTSRSARTAKGIGPGSTRRALLRAYPSLRSRGYGIYELGRSASVHTAFQVKHGRVASVALLGPATS